MVIIYYSYPDVTSDGNMNRVDFPNSVFSGLSASILNSSSLTDKNIRLLGLGLFLAPFNDLTSILRRNNFTGHQSSSQLRHGSRPQHFQPHF